jgi:hypothetical protein
VFFVANRASARRLQFLTLAENITTFQALSRFYPELPPGLAERFLNMFEMAVNLFFRYPDLGRNIFGCERQALFQRRNDLLADSPFLSGGITGSLSFFLIWRCGYHLFRCILVSLYRSGLGGFDSAGLPTGTREKGITESGTERSLLSPATLSSRG